MKILALLGLVLCSSAFADTLSVKINSFRSVDSTGHVAEACGQVTVGADALIPQFGNYIAVTVTSDPGHDPGQYTVLADPTGAFCTVIATTYGEVEATAWLPTAATSAKSGIAKMTSKK
jgi:hypothetical protein